MGRRHNSHGTSAVANLRLALPAGRTTIGYYPCDEVPDDEDEHERCTNVLPQANELAARRCAFLEAIDIVWVPPQAHPERKDGGDYQTGNGLAFRHTCHSSRGHRQSSAAQANLCARAPPVRVEPRFPFVNVEGGT